MFKKDKDREKGAQLIRDEAKKISTMFLRLSHATSPKVHSVDNSPLLGTVHYMYKPPYPCFPGPG